MTKALAIILGLIFSVTASAQTPPKKPSSTANRIGQLERKIQENEKHIQTLTTLVEELSSRGLSTFGTLDCDSHNFVELRPSGSHFLLFATCKDVEPYLEGHRITISVGNPYAISVARITGKLWYGKNLYDSVINARSVEIPMTSGLRSASWSTFVVNINPSKPEDLRSVTVLFELTTVSLPNR